MINSSIHKLILGKKEREAVLILQSFKCTFRTIMRDGAAVETADNRNDDRYNLVIKSGVVEAVIAG